MSNLAPMMSSAKQDWETPENVLELVRKFFGGQIGCDPCTTEANPTKALSYCAFGHQDGLACSWQGNDKVFMNPPYSRELPKWIAKACRERAGYYGCEIITLTPARTDTRWFRQLEKHSDAICFWHGRMKFKGAKDAAPFPTCLGYFGTRVETFRAVFQPYGWVHIP